MLKIYFKPNCATCQTALSLLKKNTDEEYEIIEYLVETPTEKEIREIKFCDLISSNKEESTNKNENSNN